ncbi:putative Type IV pilus assembly PilZ [Desulfamplus magnetovallimortis]|uniref:Putative Type IV pilus assembly PilZ n=1 Tax=Desulfamplus magnetovallimortis TaxID=1246637 RepID=A0A1W1HDX9_9BACT|nr:PilZ domain-containing protein [Desulfamplus magnetovallimortis]SLM30643.1 putative Type IV pilus assembly PilZ [Desulfamplus magnetovallimortis]
MERAEIKHSEIRKYPRMTPSKDVYAVLGMDKSVIGKLCDISMGGLSCRYFTQTENGTDYDSVDLFTLDNDLYMTKVPCSVVYIVNLDANSEMESTMAVKSRRIGVKFNGLSYVQKSQLKTFVEKGERWN